MVLFPNKRKYICIGIGIGIGQKDLKNIGVSDIGKNPISCIPTFNTCFIYFTCLY